MKKVLPAATISMNSVPACAGQCNGICCSGNKMCDGFKCYQCDYWRASEDGKRWYCRYYEREGFPPDGEACSNFT